MTQTQGDDDEDLAKALSHEDEYNDGFVVNEDDLGNQVLCLEDSLEDSQRK